jgi:stage IV sporulation protein A
VLYTTAGGGGVENIQPIVFRHSTGDFAISYNGNLVNSARLKKYLESKGSLFLTTSDCEIIANLIKKDTTKQGQQDRIHAIMDALNMVESKGYGIVMPGVDELRLEEPQIVKQNGAYGVRLCASAQSIHMIRANIETEINPIVGTEQQSEELVRSMLKEFEAEPQKIWNSNMFGKTLYELVNEGLHTKLEHIPDESRTKLSETLERIVNEGSNGLICIIL